jgi:hypothetical protein
MSPRGRHRKPSEFRNRDMCSANRGASFCTDAEKKLFLLGTMFREKLFKAQRRHSKMRERDKDLNSAHSRETLGTVRDFDVSGDRSWVRQHR